MTYEEQRRQRVELRLDMEDAERNLAHLQERAIRSAESLEAVARKLRKNAGLAPSRADFDAETELQMCLTVEQFAMLKSSGDSIVSQIAELRQERQHVFHLRERDANLARVSGISATQI